MKNILFVISGPSGVGKGTVANMIYQRNENVALSISCTTRSPREGEVEGESYFFITKEEFAHKINKGGFLEFSEHFNNYYGTPKQFVEDKLKTNDVMLEIDVNGGLQVKKNMPEAILIMLVPPSQEELIYRLCNRHTESLVDIKNRLSRVEYELSKQSEYDYVVVNDKIEQAYEDIIAIINKEKTRN